MMEREFAAHQARQGEGVLTFAAALRSKSLKDIETLDLRGKYTTLKDVIKALQVLFVWLQRLNPHPVDKSALVMETQSVVGLVVHIARVSGRQMAIDLGESFEKIAENEAARGVRAVEAATKIAAAIRKDENFYIEDLDACLATSELPDLTIEALLAMGPNAPQLYSSEGALPAMDGDKLPRTLASKQTHRLTVVNQGGVDSISGEVVVGVIAINDSNSSLKNRLGSRGIVKIKVASEHDQRYFAAAQCAAAEVEITVAAVIPVHPDLRRGQLILQLIRIESALSYSDLLRKALAQSELAF